MSAPAVEQLPPPPPELQQPPRYPWLGTVKITAAAFLLALIVGAFLIAFSDDGVIESLSYFFSYPWDFFTRSADAVASS